MKQSLEKGRLMNIIDEIMEKQHGFVAHEQIDEIIAHDRFFQLLVRTGSGRFVCAAQYVKHYVNIINESTDYVRDVSIPATM
jgi:hypothetical protein